MFKQSIISLSKLSVALVSIMSAMYAHCEKSSSQLYGGLGSVSFDPQVAASMAAQIDDSAFALEFGYERRLKSGFVWGAGINFYSYSDNAGFSVITESQFGSVKRSDSDASAFTGFGELGYSFTPNKKVALSLMAGYERVFTSSRSISNCRNCPSEDIDIDAGAYLTPKVVYTFDNNWTLGLSYNGYVSGDIDNMVMLQIGKRFQFLGGEI